MGTYGISYLRAKILKIYPVILEFIEKKKKKFKIGLKIGFGNLRCIPLEGRILRIHPAFLESLRKETFFKICNFFFFFIFK